MLYIYRNILLFILCSLKNINNDKVRHDGIELTNVPLNRCATIFNWSIKKKRKKKYYI